MKKRGFTLVELIAVIGILAVILVIAIPKVNDYILKRKQDNFLTTARNISRQIEYDNLDFKNFTKVTLGDLNLENLSDSRFDLEKSVAYVEEGEVYIDLVGKGDYSGMHACRVQSSTKELAIQDEACGEEIILTYIDFEIDLDGGKTLQKLNDKYVSGSYLTLEVPKKDNFTFKGWEIVSGNSELTGNRLKFGTDALNIKALWKEHPVFTVNLNGGTTVQQFKSHYLGGTIIELAKPIRLGYDFAGWEVTSGNGIVSGNHLTMGSEDTTISAKWIAHSYILSFDTNGGSNGGNVPTIADYGNVVYIPIPIKTGYTFTGWTITGINVETAKYGNSQTNITTLIGEDGATIIAEYFKDLNPRNESNVKFVANWIPNIYAVTFKANGGTISGITSKEVTYDSVYGELPTATRSGYTFDGWYVNGQKITADSTVKIVSDSDITANWIDITPPQCTLQVTTSGVSFKTKTDNDASGVPSYGIVKSTTASYNGNTTIGLSTGTFYGYVRDAAGNTNKCSVTLSSTSAEDYVCGSYVCGSYVCGSYICGGYTYCGTASCGCNCWADTYCDSYCNYYCDSWCTRYNCPSGTTKLNNSYCYK